MPRLIDLSSVTPVIAQEAVEAFGSSVRINLIRFFRENPGPQREAVTTLGLASQSVSHNVRVLTRVGVLVSEPAKDGRSPVIRVDLDRLDELAAGLRAFTRG